MSHSIESYTRLSAKKYRYDALNANPFIEDIDIASKNLNFFVASVEKICEGGIENAGENLESIPQVSKTITPQLLTALGTQKGVSQDLLLSQIYDSLIKSWISTLSEAIPGRVRGATEKRLREIATHLYLASFGVLLNSKSEENENGGSKQEPVPAEQEFSLPVRRKRSLSTLPTKTLANPLRRSSSPLVSSQISEGTEIMPPSRSPSRPIAPTLPTPEMTPSLHSRSSISSLEAEAEDAASKRLRVLASLTPQPTLPAPASDILRHWTEGMNPDDYDWETVQSSILAEHQDSEDVEDKTEAKERQRLENRLKRQRGNDLSSPSKPLQTRIGESQPSPLQESQQGSSSMGVGGTMSQMSRGLTQKGRKKKKRKEGF